MGRRIWFAQNRPSRSGLRAGNPDSGIGRLLTGIVSNGLFVDSEALSVEAIPEAIAVIIAADLAESNV